MAGLRPRPGLRTLALTPQKIPDFLIPSRSPRITRTPLPSDCNQQDGIRSPCQAGSCDLDLSTRAALSLSHVPRVTTPYGFNAVLAASPCTHRRESLYHRRPLAQDPQDQNLPSGSPGPKHCPSPVQSSSRTRLLRPIQALGQELQSLCHRRPPAQEPKDSQDLVDQHQSAALTPRAGPGCGRSRMLLFGHHLVQELQRPVAALKPRSSAHLDPRPQ